MLGHKVSRLLLAGAIVAGTSCAAWAQNDADLRASQNNPKEVLVYGGGYSGQRYSPLKTINASNVSQLVPKWSLSLQDLRGIEDFPLLHDGIIYVTTQDATVAADALTGKQLWRVTHEYDPAVLRVVCCGIINRGAAIYNGLVIRGLFDMSIVAMDAKTGKEVWRVRSPDATAAQGYAFTAAPLIANGVLITGQAGAEYHARGFIEAYDPMTGKHLWRKYNVPAAEEPGSETWTGENATPGGGSSWVTGTYDPDLDLVYWGIGNPSPWNARGRKGDNLYTDSIIAFHPKTGERVWYYQATPNDPFDYDAVQTPVLGTLPIDGKARKVVMQANRNGFLYVLDAATGKLLAGNAFEKVNWADGIDMKTGRPIVNEQFRKAVAGEDVTIWPSVSGGINWQHVAFSPLTHLLYGNTMHMGNTYLAPDPKAFKPGQPSGPGTVKRVTVYDDPNVKGHLSAIDPLTGKTKWAVPFAAPNWGSTLVTAGGVVFTGLMTGEFQAYDAATGKKLYSFQTPSGIVAQPITWEKDGKQYVTVPSGAGALYFDRMADPVLANVPNGSSLWTFELKH